MNLLWRAFSFNASRLSFRWQRKRAEQEIGTDRFTVIEAAPRVLRFGSPTTRTLTHSAAAPSALVGHHSPWTLEHCVLRTLRVARRPRARPLGRCDVPSQVRCFSFCSLWTTLYNYNFKLYSLTLHLVLSGEGKLAPMRTMNSHRVSAN